MADFIRLEHTHPELSEKLKVYLVDYAKRTGLPVEWVKYGFWRWQVLPKSLQMIADKKGIDLTPKVSGKPVSFTITSGYRPCKAGGITAEGSFGTPLNLSGISETNLMVLLGDTNSTDGVIIAQNGEDNVQVYASGSVVARSTDEDSARELIELADKTIRRAVSCTGCGVCVGQCGASAISINGRVMVSEKCTRCGKCTNACPIVKFG